MNIFDLAQAELQREGKKATMSAVLDKAIRIRKFMDKNAKLANHILSGGEFIRRTDGSLRIA
jgi:hypothetical protein